jgi:hypothetical protein
MANLSNLLSAQSNLVTDQDLAAVATTGNYADLTNKPVIPSIAGLVTTEQLALKADASSLATVATTGKAIAMSIVFGG